MRRFFILLMAGWVLGGTGAALHAQNAQSQRALQNDLNEITIPEGTEFKLQLHTSINSKTSKVGDRVIATLLEPVSVEDITVLHKGDRVFGRVNEVKAAGRHGKGGYLSLQFDTLELPNHEKVAILGSLTEIFSSAQDGSSNVGPEGDVKGGGANHKKQLAMVLVPTAAAASGGIGPAIGVGLATGMVAILVPHGKQATLLAGSLVGMRLDEDVTINLPPGTFNSPAPAPSTSQ